MLIIYYVLGIMLSILHKTSLSLCLTTLRVNIIVIILIWQMRKY